MSVEIQTPESRIKEMQLRPKSGEIMLYISLHQVENMTSWETLKLAESLGFSPELRYRSWEKNGEKQVGIYALLHYEKREFDSSLEANYTTDEAFQTLTQQIQPDTAVTFAYSLKGGREGIIAA